jgi:hypothetical protein
MRHTLRSASLGDRERVQEYMAPHTTRNAQRNRLVAGVIGITAGLGLLAPAAGAHPDPEWTAYCPAFADSTTTITGGSRCAGGSTLLYYLEAVTANGSGVDHCAVLKAQADGGGPNVDNKDACGTAQVEEEEDLLGSGYPTIVNRSTSSHEFWGQVFEV